MPSGQSRRMYLVYVGAALLLVSVVSGYAYPAWGRTLWEDDFEDGNYTSDPTWTVFSTPGSTQSVGTYEGDYAFELTAPYLEAAGGGWSGAYVDLVQGDQGIAGWLDTSALASGDWAAVYTVRYSPPSVGFGTGYALAVLHDSADAIYAGLYEFNDTSYASVGTPVQVASSYQDVWVRFLATGTGSDTELLGRVWAAVVPLRVARGVQNKVLEAMAASTPATTSHLASSGISVQVFMVRQYSSKAVPMCSMK